MHLQRHLLSFTSKIIILCFVICAVGILFFVITQEAQATTGSDISKTGIADEVSKKVHSGILNQNTTAQEVTSSATKDAVELGLPDEIDAPARSDSASVGARKAIPNQAYTKYKRITIDLSEQRIYMEENGRVIWSDLVSTGIPGMGTPTGHFSVRSKIANHVMSGPGYYLPGVLWSMYFYGTYAIHGAYWHNNFGHPMSHGCVNLRDSSAKRFYDWAPVGTPVYIRY